MTEPSSCSLLPVPCFLFPVRGCHAGLSYEKIASPERAVHAPYK